MSGSDDGHIFVWERCSGSLVALLGSGAGNASVSCVAPNSSLPMLASCGQEPVVRLWTPQVITLTECTKMGLVFVPLLLVNCFGLGWVVWCNMGRGIAFGF